MSCPFAPTPKTLIQHRLLVQAHPTGEQVEEPWFLITNLDPGLDVVWSYGRRFCCEQLFCDQKTRIFQLESSGLRSVERINRLLLLVAVAVLISSLQGYAVSRAGERRRVDPHWKRGLSIVRIGLHGLQQSVLSTGRALLGWLPVPLQALKPCIPSLGIRRRQKHPWFTLGALPPPAQPAAPLTAA